ncbi:Ig-like domain repeat protein [Glaciimonas sp. GG7]
MIQNQLFLFVMLMVRCCAALTSVARTLTWVAIRKKITGTVVSVLLLCCAPQSLADVGWMGGFPDEANVGEEVSVRAYANAKSNEWCAIYFDHSSSHSAYSDDKSTCANSGITGKYTHHIPDVVVNVQIWENAFWGNSHLNKPMKIRPLSGNFSSAEVDTEIKGRVTLKGVTKGNGATSYDVRNEHNEALNKTISSDSVIINNLTPGEHTLQLHVFYNDLHGKIVKEEKVRVLGGNFQAWAENGRARTKGHVQGGADELRIYRNGSHFKTVTNFTTNGTLSEYDFILTNLPGGVSNLKAYAYKGSQWLTIGSTQVTLPPDKPATPDRPTWVSPAAGTYDPSGPSLKISGKVSYGVDTVSVRSRLATADNSGSWEYEQARSVSTSNGVFNNLAVENSKQWEAGKSYEVAFDSKRGTSDWSAWSDVRHFSVPAPKPPKPTWISPGHNTSYQPSDTNPLKISGRTIQGVYLASVSTRTFNGTDTWAEVSENVTVGADNTFSGVPVRASTKWEAGKSYEVRFDVRNSAGYSVFSDVRKFNVPRGAPGKPTLTKPTERTWKASSDNPLIISGQSDADFNRLNVRIKSDGRWSDYAYQTVSVGADGIFEDIEIEESKTWEKGKKYTIQLTATRDLLNSVPSDEYEFEVPQEKPGKPTWISPGNNTPQKPTSTNPLAISGQTIPGVTKVNVQTKAVIDGSWSASEEHTVIVGTNGIFNDVHVEASKSWDQGKDYEVRFEVSNGLRSEWSETRKFNVPYYGRPGTPTLTTPADRIWEASATNPLIIGGLTDPGVTQIFTRTKAVGDANWLRSDSYPVTVGDNGIFNNIAVRRTDAWEKGKKYIVQITASRDTLLAPWSVDYVFYVPHDTPVKPTWISPGNGSWLQPSSANPLTISGQTVTGVNKVQVRTSLLGESWASDVTHDVTVDDNDRFNDLEIAASKTWENGKAYEIEFRVERDGKQSAWSDRYTLNVGRDKPDTPTWLSPAHGSWQEPTASTALMFSAQTVAGVNKVEIQVRAPGESWSASQMHSVTAIANSRVTNVPIEASKTWKSGSNYEVRFRVERDRRPSEWSDVRLFKVPRDKPETPTWLSPDHGSWQKSSASTALTFSGQTVAGVNKVEIQVRAPGESWSASQMYPVTVVANSRVTNVPIEASKTWKNGSDYEVRFRVERDDRPSEWSVVRLFKVPREIPATPSWISPTAGSWQKPSASAPLTFNGRSIEGVNKVEVRTKVSGEDNWTATESHSVPVGADQMVKDIPIAASKSWENGKIYTVEFRVERDAQQSGWASRDFKIDTTPPSIVWATGTDPMVGHASPGKPFAVKVDVSDALSGVDPATVKLRWKIGAGNWSSDAVMEEGTGNRYTAQIEIPAMTQNDQPLTLQVKATDRAGNVLSYDDKHQHIVSVSKPVVSITPRSNRWHNGGKIKISGEAKAAAEMVRITIGQSKKTSGGYGHWHDLCNSKETCRTPNNVYSFNDVEYKHNLWSADVNIVLWAVDINGIETYSTANGARDGDGEFLQYDGKAPEIALATAKWHADGSLTVSGTVSDDASGLGAQGDGKKAIVLRWQAGGGGQHTVDASGTGVGGAVNFSHTFAAGVFPTSSGVTFSVTASDRAGNISTATEVAVISPIPKLTLSVKQLQTPRHAWFANETLVYRLTLEVGEDSVCATNSHLSYALPPQLQRQPNTSLVLGVSTPTVGCTLNSGWGEFGRKNLLAAGGKLCAGQSLTVDIPLVITANASGETIVNHIEATAQGLTELIKIVQTDSFTVMPEQGALRFEKKVDKDTAVSGEDLTYTIIFSNRSEQHLTMHEIIDNVAAYTRLQGMVECGVMPAGLRCTPIASTQGALRWEFSGELAPGKSGQVTYKVRIQ